ncbi:VOC family protein [Paenibacillus sp.]|jgi:hypothetical protein|uniref:VOC family protein n=1 Tax=Paenibacillus sp. TaxID=58172 RepID=UPI002836B141|nr:VOC family protein [Paenibacillus sp.]MDR0269570.1 VOC family protein [Paenibacillus sp.]
MLHLDHVTIAVRDLHNTMNDIQKATGIEFSKSVIPFPGAIGQVAYLGTGFLELISLNDANEACTTPLGAAFASYASQREGIFGVALEATGGLHTMIDAARSQGVDFIGPNVQQAPLEDGTSIPFKTAFIGSHMPWLIEYERSRTWPIPYALSGVEIYTNDIKRDVSAYAAAYQLAASTGSEGDGLSRKLILDRGWLSLKHTDQPEKAGFNTIVVDKGEASYRIQCLAQGIKVTS